MTLNGFMLRLLAALIMLIGWVVFTRATLRSIGAPGVLLAAALCAAVVWLFVDQGWLDLNNTTTLAWSLTFMTAVVLGVGVSWSHIRRRLTGQLDTDDVDE